MGAREERWNGLFCIHLLNFHSINGACSYQVSRTVFIWDSLTFLPQEGHLKQWNILLIFSCFYFRLQGKSFYFSRIFSQTEQMSTDPEHFILEFSKKEKWESSYYFKSNGFLGFVYIKLSHLILAVFLIIVIPHYWGKCFL